MKYLAGSFLAMSCFTALGAEVSANKEIHVFIEEQLHSPVLILVVIS